MWFLLRPPAHPSPPHLTLSYAPVSPNFPFLRQDKLLSLNFAKHCCFCSDVSSSRKPSLVCPLSPITPRAQLGSTQMHSAQSLNSSTLRLSHVVLLPVTCKDLCLSHWSSTTQWPRLYGSQSYLQQQAWCLTCSWCSVITCQVGLLLQRKYNHIVDSWGLQKQEGGIKILPSEYNHSVPPGVTFPGPVFS